MRRCIAEKVAYLRRDRPGDRHLLIVPGGDSRVEEDETARTFFIRSPRVSRRTQYRALVNLAAVSRVVRSERPDLIECADPYQLAGRAQSLGRELGIPTVGYYHSHFVEAYVQPFLRRFLGAPGERFALAVGRRYTQRTYNRFTLTLAPSPALVEILESWGVRNVRLAELGVDGSLFHPDDGDRERERARLAAPAEASVLLYVGRLAVEKNVDTLFATFRELHARAPGRYHLVVIGDGNSRAVLEAVRAETGAVTWLPALPAAELPAAYRAADLFVHPGLLETFGLVTLEAQACGLPVCGIRGSRMDHIVFRGLEHWADTNTPASLGAAVQRMCGLDLRSLGREVARKAAASYDWKTRFAHIFSLYDEARGMLVRSDR